MNSDELGRALLSRGCDPVQVRQALLDAGVEPFAAWYRQEAERVHPFLVAALRGDKDVPAPPEFPEEWLVQSLTGDHPIELWEVLETVRGMNYEIPNSEQLVSAFLRLRDQGRLAVSGDRFGLSTEARKAFESNRNDKALGRTLTICPDGDVFGRELTVSGSIVRMIRGLIEVTLSMKLADKDREITGMLLGGYGMDLFSELFGSPRRPRGTPVIVQIQALTSEYTVEQWTSDSRAHPRRYHFLGRGTARLDG